jgi:hypothetical protein
MVKMLKQNKIVFNATVLGAGHIKENKPCQDYSDSWQLKNSDAVILVVCDGHGGDVYVRSDVGSRLAGEIALKCVKTIIQSKDLDWICGHKGAVASCDAEECREQRIGIYEQNAVFHALFKTIYDRWEYAIGEDVKANPFTEQEKECLGDKGIVEAYGTTLMVYAQTRRYWLAFQIGDGRMLACDAEGDWKQIVPWDDDCFLNHTTSLCSPNSVSRFRYAFDGTASNPVSVFCCSDGVEDSYGDYDVAPEHLRNYFDSLAKVFVKEGKEVTLERLKVFLPKLSQAGSKDDMSIAGFVDTKVFGNIRSYE